MYKIVFVVLHYETIKDTKECIDSLLKFIVGEDVQIVVVDNGSRIGKLISLEARYEKISQIHFLYSEENLGFACGNNIGYRFARDELGADLIVLANNDLVFKQEFFIKNLIFEYEKTGFDVAGPKIISLMDYENQNPVPRIYHSVKDVKKRIFKFRVLLLLSHLNLDIKIKYHFSSGIPKFQSDMKLEDFQLHGSCMFFANRYLKEFDGLYDKTFMYGEESILKYRVEKNDMKMCYFDDVIVYHKEGSSTQAIWGKGKESRQFFYKWNIKGCNLLKRLMIKYNND